MPFFLTELLGRLRSPGTVADVSLAQRVRSGAVLLLLLIFLHALLMVMLEGMRFADALWLTVTTMTTVGYGDYSAATPAGRFATVVLLYAFGVFLLARMAGLVVELRLDKRQQILKGTWRWRMQGHILIINAPTSGAERYFQRLLGQLRADPEYARVPVQIVSEAFPDGLPAAIREQGAVHFSGSPHDSEVLRSVSVDHARHIVLLACDENDPRSDSLNFDILLELHEIYTGAKITVEVVDDGGRDRFRRFGAHTVMRPARAYPEMIVRAITSPGAESVIEDLMTPAGSVTRRYNLRIRELPWSEVVRVLMEKGLGTALAYVSDSREIVPNPQPDTVVNARGLILLAPAERIPDRDRVRDALEPLQPSQSR